MFPATAGPKNMETMMEDRQDTGPNQQIYRIDKFAVPETARAELVGRVHETHDLLRRQPGFLQDFLVEEPSGEGTFNLMTIVEWESRGAYDGARSAVAAMRAQSGFDPKSLMQRLGVTVIDMAVYQPLELNRQGQPGDRASAA